MICNIYLNIKLINITDLKVVINPVNYVSILFRNMKILSQTEQRSYADTFLITQQFKFSHKPYLNLHQCLLPASQRVRNKINSSRTRQSRSPSATIIRKISRRVRYRQTWFVAQFSHFIIFGQPFRRFRPPFLLCEERVRVTAGRVPLKLTEIFEFGVLNSWSWRIAFLRPLH